MSHAEVRKEMEILRQGMGRLARTLKDLHVATQKILPSDNPEDCFTNHTREWEDESEGMKALLVAPAS